MFLYGRNFLSNGRLAKGTFLLGPVIVRLAFVIVAFLANLAVLRKIKRILDCVLKPFFAIWILTLKENRPASLLVRHLYWSTSCGWVMELFQRIPSVILH